MNNSDFIQRGVLIADVLNIPIDRSIWFLPPPYNPWTVWPKWGCL